MVPRTFYEILAAYLFFFFRKFVALFYAAKPAATPKGIKDIEGPFVDRQKLVFDALDRGSFNGNVDAVFYDKSKYVDLMMSGESEQEKVWKRRVLMESTPRGTVIMYFDAYKLGFAYYSDVNISYDILNACAMKYVRLFYCYDFYLHQTDQDGGSPLIKIHDSEEVSDELKEKRKLLNDKTFAQFREYNKVSKTTTAAVKQPKQMQNLSRNRFVRVGRISEYNPLPKKVNKIKQLDHATFLQKVKELNLLDLNTLLTTDVSTDALKSPSSDDLDVPELEERTGRPITFADFKRAKAVAASTTATS
jgi:hypothetical protein